MPKKDSAPPRKTVKARGALPAPVVTPKRQEIPWYKRRTVQLGIAFAVVFIGVLAFNVIKDLREGARERRLDERSIEQFERQLTLLNAPLQGVYERIQTGVDQLTAGQLPPEEYRTQAEGWVGEFRTLYNGIKEAEVRQELEPLVESKALFTQGSVILVDAAKAYAQAGAVEGPARETALNLGRYLLNHGSAVIAMAEREIQRLKNERGLNDPEVAIPEPILPEEEPPPAQQPPVIPPSPEPAATPTGAASPGAPPSPPASPAAG